MVNNDIQYIKDLLDAFYDGTTSLEEEKKLTEYFLGQEVAEELKLDQKIFCELSSVQKEYDFSSLESKIDSLIDKLDVEEKNENKILYTQPKLIINWRWITSVAASVLIILCAGIYFHNSNRGKIIADTYSNPEEAYIETQRALMFVSSKLNKGFDQMESAQKNLEKTNKIIAKNIEL